ncbi:sorbosone dehydrogenase family protein [Echinicola soli]|uniref:Sorbosone dehydrogenase family protein n=1 Tax=Echinicola soli TaxID=2591634 RepID=A0A514CKS6_9BACT|nr:sorbosone dehydrogenase family protein [Echinicola soli]QDH80357.1 sorbosone dehydrogenase family protein [Echinicola soli]
MKISLSLFLITLLCCYSCSDKVSKEKKENISEQAADTVQTAVGDLILPPPYSSESVTNESKMVDWPEGGKPKAPEGFTVSLFAKDMKHPRNTYVASNGDVFVAESSTKNSADRIVIFQDKDGDGDYELQENYLEGLNQPYGILVLDDYFYVANTDGLYRYPYEAGKTTIQEEGEKIVDLPAGGYNNHWTRNLLASKDGSKIFISVGSASNVGEHGMDEEERRACILQVNPDGSGEITYAHGLRNPVGMSINPITGELWTAVNERDKLGNDLVPDYVTSVKKGGFYGWPYTYYGAIPDPRMEGKAPEMVKKTLVPDVPVGSHTASLGLTFYTKDAFPEKYQQGAFVGQHGSWNRKELSGYKVIYIPFSKGKPSGKPVDFLTGFISDADQSEVYGRPVDVTLMPDGSLLVNDDNGNRIWRVSANK